MSVASPEHRLPPELEEVAPPGTYDPHYTIDISNRMQVPDKISVDGEDRDSDSEFFGQHALKADMNVPDRILVAGMYVLFQFTVPVICISDTNLIV